MQVYARVDGLLFVVLQWFNVLSRLSLLSFHVLILADVQLIYTCHPFLWKLLKSGRENVVSEQSQH